MRKWITEEVDVYFCLNGISIAVVFMKRDLYIRFAEEVWFVAACSSRMALLGWILFFCEFAKITLRILFDQHEKERHGLTCDKVDRMKTRLNRAILSCSPAFWIA